MRYLRIRGSSPLSALAAVASRLDGCWWYLGGHGFTMTDAFLRRIAPRRWTAERTREHWDRLIRDYVAHDPAGNRVGRPGFFSRLGDSVDFHWSTFFAIEAADLPTGTLAAVEGFDRMWFDPLRGLPPDVAVVARDVDSAYQDYGFSDASMYQTVVADLRRRGLEFEEVTRWPHGGAGSGSTRSP